MKHSKCLNKERVFFRRRYCSQIIIHLNGILQEAPESMPSVISHNVLRRTLGPLNTTLFSSALLEGPQTCFGLWLIALSLRVSGHNLGGWIFQGLFNMHSFHAVTLCWKQKECPKAHVGWCLARFNAHEYSWARFIC